MYIQCKRSTEINRSLLKLETMRRCLIGGGASFILLLTTSLQADVFFDSQKNIQDNTDALVDVLNSSVVPGGVRSVKVNGSDLRVRRFANPSGDKSEFYNVWMHAAEKKQAANDEIFTVLDEQDPIYSAFKDEIPYTALLKDLNKLMSIGDDFAESQSAMLKELVVDAVETPFSYETQQHRVIASVPVKAIDPNSTLARETPSNGYLFLSEKLPGSTVSKAFWQIEFGENFSFPDLFGRDGDDVKGVDSPIPRYPGSKLSMTFSEKTGDWNSQNWSYESQGDVLSHMTHYVNAFDLAGFGKESNSVVRSDYGLVQFANQTKEATLFVELTDPLTQSVQVTLQVRSN